MSNKFIVCAVDRKAQGLDHVFRAGRGWPGGEEVEIEVLDQDEDVTIEVPSKDDEKKTRAILDPKRLGRLAWESVKADKRLAWRPAGALTPAQALPKVAELEAAIVGLQKERDALAAELGNVKADRDTLAGQVEELKAKADASQAKVSELEALLESLTATKPEDKKGSKQKG